MVVLETMRPAMPCATAASTIGSTAAGDRSGAIFTRMGGRGPLRASRASTTAARMSRSIASPCRSRRPGVLGEETLMAT